MKLLIVTQTVDTEDPVLGFFVRWLEEFSKHVERIEVVCLKEGKHALPENVHVHSLGKEKLTTENTIIYDSVFRRVRYVWRFLSLAWRLRHDYDAVFVHMNQEYILLAGGLWKLLDKHVYLWRNHYAGSFLTDIAAVFCTKIFCTSKHSYTAKYAKTVLMPVGVDTTRFSPGEQSARAPRSILFLGRIAPSKRPEMLIDALVLLARDGVEFSASIVGSPLPKDEAYYASLKERVRTLGLDRSVSFHPGISNDRTPNLYRAHEIFVNTSPSGMLDKTIFEAAASGCTVFAASKDFAGLSDRESYFDSSTTLAERLASALVTSSVRSSQALVEKNSLAILAEKLISVMISRT